HGLLRCTNQNCQETISSTLGFQYCLYNRDLAAYLHFILISRSFRDDGTVPERFRRQSTRRPRRRREKQDIEEGED
ncbi:hypothetical protein INT48_003866, partial [Thamnidium elegans]